MKRIRFLLVDKTCVRCIICDLFVRFVRYLLRKHVTRFSESKILSMPLKHLGPLGVARRQLTRESLTRNFEHLLPNTREVFRPRQGQGLRVNVVPVKNRIKWWNIVPGDQVRVRGRESEGTKEVFAINKFANRVFLKNTKQPVGTPLERTNHLTIWQ
jgi:hypothetical protein